MATPLNGFRPRGGSILTHSKPESFCLTEIGIEFKLIPVDRQVKVYVGHKY